MDKYLASDVMLVAYRPGDNITSDEFEVAASTQMFNNRVTINGNVVMAYYTNTGKMVVTLMWMLNSIRLNTEPEL